MSKFPSFSSPCLFPLPLLDRILSFPPSASIALHHLVRSSLFRFPLRYSFNFFFAPFRHAQPFLLLLFTPESAVTIRFNFVAKFHLHRIYFPKRAISRITIKSVKKIPRGERPQPSTHARDSVNKNKPTAASSAREISPHDLRASRRTPLTH